MRLVRGEGFSLIGGDCIEALRKFSAGRFDSVVTDPPYELGFMGKKWDGTGVAYSVDLWRETLRVLKPGGHMLCFGGTRTYRRMTCAIEDAGFEIRDSLHWFYGTGFPKSLSVAKEIDRAGGNSDLAAKWEGWGTALKPAHEPIVLARKPLEGTVAANVLAHGTGGLNIDATRIGTSKMSGLNPNVGRWPANVLLDESAAAELDTQTGHLNAGGGGASRFFYVAKPGRSERDLGCEDFPPKPVSGIGALREGRTGGARNFHPTVKPVALMRCLVKLVTPPGGVVLDPFAGSGTTGIAARLEGRPFLGIEREPEYLQIAQARITGATP